MERLHHGLPPEEHRRVVRAKMEQASVRAGPIDVGGRAYSWGCREFGGNSAGIVVIDDLD